VNVVAVAEVFEPARLGPVELRNRVIKAATFEGMTPRGLVTDELIEFHLRSARGGVGMTTVAYCAVSPEGRTDRHQIWMRPEAVPGLRRLAEAVHAEGAAISAQIGHAGPVANPVSNRLAALGPSRRPSPLGMRMIKAASVADHPQADHGPGHGRGLRVRRHGPRPAARARPALSHPVRPSGPVTVHSLQQVHAHHLHRYPLRAGPPRGT